jgi:Ca2+-transporting ATPase
VLADDRLEGLVEALRLGRTSHVNIRKVLRYLVSTNAAESMLMAGTAIAGLREPLTPLQLLWLNIVTDVFPAVALGLEPPQPGVLSEPPHDPTRPILDRDDLLSILQQAAVMTGTSFAASMWARAQGGPAGTIAFHSLTLSQILHTLICRSQGGGLEAVLRRPVSGRLAGAMAAGLALQLAAQAVPPLRSLLGLRPIPLSGLVPIAGGAVASLSLNALFAARASARQPERARARASATAPAQRARVADRASNGMIW